MISPNVAIPRKDNVPGPRGSGKPPASPLPAENAARIRDLGFTASKHITMYGERFELVSDPFAEGACTAIRALSGSDPAIRTIHLPTAVLLGFSDRFRRN